MNYYRLQHILTTTVVLLLIGIVFSWPLVIGVIIKSAFGPTLEALSEPNRWSLQEVEFNRGWFNSEARTVFTLEGEFAKQTRDAQLSLDSKIPLQATLIHQIHHGPVLGMGRPSFLPALALIETTIEFPPETHNWLQQIFLEVTPIHLRTLFQWDGTVITRVESPAAQSTLKGGAKLNWQGIGGTLEIGKERNTILGDLTMPLLELANDAGRLTLEQFAIHLDTRQHLSGIWLGDIGVSLKSFGFTVPEKSDHNFIIAGLHATSISQERGKTFNAQITIDLDDLSIGGQPFSSGGFTAEVQGIDLISFAKLYKDLRALDQQPIINSAHEDKLKQLFVSQLPRLIRYSPEVGISRLALKTPQGVIEGKLRLIVVPELDNILPDFTPAQLIQNVDATIDISTPSILIADLLRTQVMREIISTGEFGNNREEIEKLAQAITEQRIAVLLAQNFLISEKERYRINAKFIKGKLEINGYQRNELFNFLGENSK